MTSAIAIQPAPPVSPSTHCGVSARLKQAPPTPASAPPATHVRVAVGGDADPHRVGRLRRLADRAHVQARPGARQVERDQRDDRPRGVDEPRLPEHDRPEDRHVRQPEGVDGLELVLRGRVGEAEVVAEVRREPGRAGEDRQREPETIWFARSVITRNAKRSATARTGEGGDEHREEQRRPARAADALHRPEPHHGADEHHPLDAEVEHPRALREQLAERGEEQRRAVGDAGGDHDDEDRVVQRVPSAGAPRAVACRRRPTRIR